MKKILIFLFSMVLVASCVDDLDDYNVDPKRTTEAPPATLFTNAVLSVSDVLATPNVNFNNYRFYVQHWASTQYVDEPRYNMVQRLIPQNMWQELYRDALIDLKEAKSLVNENEFLEAGEKNNQLAQIEMMEVYTWFVIVTTWGDVPYTEALDPTNALPVYDDDQAIYNDLIRRLNTAIGLIDPGSSGFEEGDLFYNGDMTQWLKFGNSLKLKMGMVLADVDPGQARTLVEEAAPNVFTSNADNAVIQYLDAPPNNNPISDNVKGPFTSREDYVAASTLVDVMNELNDPRRPEYFTTVNGEFIGGQYGFQNTYTSFSTVSAKIAAPNFEALMLDYSEVEFLLAEAVERGFNVPGTAEEHYNNAITASITYWGRTAEEAEAYLSQPGVNYTSAPGDWRQKIGTQKWIALYNRGFDAWLEWRRLDAPDLQPPAVPGSVELIIPKRLIYPVNEQTLNPENRAAAAAAIGGDEASTRLFWDVQ
ncbi:SusD/RagB family nutrient-binding outer membrane lipoprotein [Pontibacter chinhatensis]|uniref:Starch-binding associating with outer membrane n=1 Tax=Pontibacter chinhatensis TaxID=1436961 RepID=A0A1I2YNT4_9BACT|nr:SusD/RagB family nutrient-binding outer membrane lipoprotein [Pontibacter chinhatensis]SFH27293.1 Starch-binding associating with outer membrane [Pontibacter chinhatensis]